MRFFAYLLAAAMAMPATTFAALPEATGQAALDTTKVNLINQDLKTFFEQFQASDSRKTVQKAAQKRYDNNGDKLFVPAIQKLLDLDQKRSERFQIEDAQIKSERFCEGELNNPAQCLYTGQFETIDDVIAQEGRRGIGSNDDPRKLVDNGNEASYEDNLYRMQSKALTSAEVKTQGWSSDYWALAGGATSKRYQLQHGEQFGLAKYPSDLDWHKVGRYYSTDRFSNYVDQMANHFYVNGDNLTNFIAVLSPAEKYDILVDDGKFSLTKAQMETGKDYAFNADGTPKAVETWMGICHGWAAAAYMDERPAKTISVYNNRGTEVVFYPDDVKALSVLKWANGQTARFDNSGRLTYGTKFIGGRCNKKDGESVQENEDGVVTDPDCFDTNPGSWHVSIVNQLGIVNKQAGKGHRTIIIDATFDYEVWNQPMVRYSYSYFNPRTKKQVNTIQQATEEMSGYTFAGDSFGADIRKENYRGRASKPAYVVGVVMEAAYVVETEPTGARTDNKNNDAVTAVRYVYDLELDENGKILGGEWYNNTHPDFLWTPTPDAFAYNSSDAEGLSKNWTWASNNPTIPAQVARHARSREAKRDATPLAVIVDGLIAKAKK